MKYIVVLGDGMADEPIEALGNKTPLAYARTPVMDRLSKMSEIGMVHTIPDGMKPGSDTANLAVLGYDPKIYYSGRSPLEALSIGVPMKATDIALRCNIVTLSEEDVPFEEKKILDHSSGEISTEDCTALLDAVRKELETEEYRFYAGTSYRHCLIWENGEAVELTPPHDVLGQVIGGYLPKDEKLREMMKKSYGILVNHPLNIERKKQGLNPANCCWFWGAGTKPALDSSEEKTGRRGMMAQGQAALKALMEDGYDFAYIHVEAPDEMGHQGSVEKKVQAIEYLDARVLKPLTERLDKEGMDYRLMVLPDHPTPIRVRTHTADSVPYMLYDSTAPLAGNRDYNEEAGKESGNNVEQGYRLIEHLFSV